LPHGAALPVYNPATRTWKNYVASRDRRLRESAEPDSAQLPPFRHPRSHFHGHDVNIFLVTINAQIKIRRYFRMIQQDPPTTPLPYDVLALMSHIMELVELLFWEPAPAKGSNGEAIQLSIMRKNPERAAKASQLSYTEITSSEESPTPTVSRSVDWGAFPSVEEKIAYANALMCGHGIYSLPLIFVICRC